MHRRIWDGMFEEMLRAERASNRLFWAFVVVVFAITVISSAWVLWEVW